jgi:protein phosphatase
MVPETGVHRILREASSLPEAGRRLIAAANEAGGRDNITVVLFRIEEVDDAAGADEGTAHHEQTLAGPSAPRAQDVRAALAVAEPATAEHRVPRRPAVGSPPPEPARRPRGRAWRFGRGLLIALVFGVPVFLGAFIASQSVYFLGTSDSGYLTLYRGLPYDLPLGLELYSRNYESSVPVSALPAATRRSIEQHELRSRDDAADIVGQAERGELAGQDRAS